MRTTTFVFMVLSVILAAMVYYVGWRAPALEAEHVKAIRAGCVCP